MILGTTILGNHHIRIPVYVFLFTSIYCMYMYTYLQVIYAASKKALSLSLTDHPQSLSADAGRRNIWCSILSVGMLQGCYNIFACTQLYNIVWYAINRTLYNIHCHNNTTYGSWQQQLVYVYASYCSDAQGLSLADYLDTLRDVQEEKPHEARSLFGCDGLRRDLCVSVRMNI